MCGSFIISKVGSTIVGINNHDGTYTVTTKGKLPKDTSTETLNIDDIKSRCSEYLSLDSDTFEKKKPHTIYQIQVMMYLLKEKPKLLLKII